MAGEIEYYSTFEDIVTLWKSTLIEIENAIPHIKGTVPYINKDTTKYDNSMKGVFYYCSNLKYIPCDIFKNQRNVLDFSFALAGCKSLVLDADLTSEIFKGCTKAKSFARTFYGCNGRSVAENGCPYTAGCPGAMQFLSQAIGVASLSMVCKQRFHPT